MLSVRGLEAGYGAIQVLRGVDFDMPAAHVATILGRNGSGRSTTCKAMMGIVPPIAGQVQLKGRDLAGKPSHVIAHAGLGYVPEERLTFTTLTVEENLVLGQKTPVDGAARWSMNELYDLFPRLRERRNVRAGYLSGGEQQMLTMFRTLLGCPSAILIDEPTEGLAPMIVEVVGETVREMKRRGLAVILLEQKLRMAMKVADAVLVMGHGQIVWRGAPAAFESDPSIRRQWLEVA